MGKSSRKHGSSSSPKSSKSSRSSSRSSHDSASTASSYKSAISYETRPTAPTSAASSPRPSVKAAKQQPQPQPQPQQQPQPASCEDDLSPSTSCCPRSSVETYRSDVPSDVEMDDVDMESYDDFSEIPPLPAYRREPLDTSVRPSTPQDFAKLFPSMNRLSIRHDDFTSDGNMNLRVDTAVPGRRRLAMQLFHLRMYDLNRREFSLRRYCRESGREVCNSKRKYIEPAATDLSRPNLQRSVSSALKSLGSGINGHSGNSKPAFRRTNSGGSLFGSSKNSRSSKSSKSDQIHNSQHGSGNGRRPGSSSSSSGGDGDDEFADSFARHLTLGDRKHKPRPVPSNSIKLEFSNYARVDVTRRGGKSSKRYEFEWWGHKYAWKRVADKHVAGVVSFHLVRDGGVGAANASPVAHIVPETRSPNQVLADETAGGWVPPCYMWIADRTVLDAMTDVADVIVATGLMALVDDCIKDRWQSRPKKSAASANSTSAFSSSSHHRIPEVAAAAAEHVVGGPRAFVQSIFGRRPAADHHHHGSSPLRYANPISAY